MSEESTSKLIGRLEFDITRLEADANNIEKVIDRVSTMGTRLEKQFKSLNLSLDPKAANMEKMQLYTNADKMIVAEENKNRRIAQATERFQNSELRKLQAFQAKEERAAELHAAKMAAIYSRQTSQPQHGSLMGLSGGTLVRHGVWMAEAAAVGAILAPLHEAKKAVFDLSASMTKLKQVLEIVPPYDKSPEKLKNDLNELKDVAGVMAVAYGVDFNRVIDVMSQAGRRFKDVASIISVTDTALQLVVVDAVPLETAIGSVEATMSQFGLTTGQAKKALWEISAASHMLQINATDLLEAIKRSGSAFKTMKADTKEAIAAISVLAQMTAQKGGMIGNAWKSLEASFAGEKGQKALKELGIEIFDANGQLEDMSKLLIKLQEKWPQLSDRAKMHYATVLAGGKFHYQRLEAFLSDYTQAYQKALAGIETADAEMQKKLIESTMTSLPQQFRMTGASVQVLAEALLRDLTPAMIIFLSNLRQNINSLRENKDGINTLFSSGMRLAEAYVVWKLGVAAYTAATTNAAIQTAIMNGSLIKLELTARGVPVTMAAVAGSIGGVAMAAVGAAAKIGALIALLGVFNRAAGQMYDEKAQKIKDLEMDLKNAEGYLNYSPKNSLKTSGRLLMGGHYLDAMGQLSNAVWGGMHLEDKYRQQERDRIAGELERAREEKRTADEEALKRDLDNLDKIMKKYEEEANQKTAEYLKGMKNEIPDIDYTGEEGKKPKLSDITDPLKESVNEARNILTYYGDAVSLTDDKLRDFSTQEKILDTYIKNQKIPTLEQARQKYALLNDVMTTTAEKQKLLHDEATMSRVQLYGLTGAMEKGIVTTEDWAAASTLLTEEEKQQMENYVGLKTQMADWEAKHRAGLVTAKEYNAAMAALRGPVNELERNIRQLGNAYLELDYNTIQAKDAQADMVSTLIRLTREKEKENALDALAKSQKSALNALEQEKKKALDDLEEAQKARIRSLEASRDTEIDSLKRTRDAYEEASNARIKLLQDEIDAMELANDLLKEQEDLLSRQKAVEDAKTKIANLEANKNIRVIGPDGKWTYITDEIALREARKDLESAEKALADTQADIRKNARRRELDAQIKQEQDIQKTQLDSYDKQLEAARKAWDDKLDAERDAQQREKNQQQQAWDKRLDDFREAQANEKTALENHWEGMLDAERINQDAMNAILQNGLDAALLRWRSYYDQVRALQQQSVDMGGGGGSGGSSSGGGGGSSGGADPTGVIPGDYTGPVNGHTNIPSGSSLNSNFISGVTYQFDKGGPIHRDMIAKVHRDEYVLNAKTVAAMGGFGGVEKLVATINMSQSQWRMPQINPAQTSSSVTNDRRVQILGDIKLPHVYDASGLIRNLEQYAAAQ